MPYIRLLVGDFSLLRSRWDSFAARDDIVVHGIALEQVLIRILRFYL